MNIVTLQTQNVYKANKARQQSYADIMNHDK